MNIKRAKRNINTGAILKSLKYKYKIKDSEYALRYALNILISVADDYGIDKKSISNFIKSKPHEPIMYIIVEIAHIIAEENVPKGIEGGYTEKRLYESIEEIIATCFKYDLEIPERILDTMMELCNLKQHQERKKSLAIMRYCYKRGMSVQKDFAEKYFNEGAIEDVPQNEKIDALFFCCDVLCKETCKAIVENVAYWKLARSQKIRMHKITRYRKIHMKHSAYKNYYNMVQELLQESKEMARNRGNGKETKTERLKNIIEEAGYGECRENYQCNLWETDLYIVVEGISIDIEFDGYTYHKYPKTMRDKMLEKDSIYVIRITDQWMRLMPEDEIVAEEITKKINKIVKEAKKRGATRLNHNKRNDREKLSDYDQDEASDQNETDNFDDDFFELLFEDNR